MSEKSVQIPLSLFYQTIDVLECLEINPSDPSHVSHLNSVLSAFQKKKQSIDLRKSYTKILFAQNDDERFDARMKYLYDKRKFYHGR